MRIDLPDPKPTFFPENLLPSLAVVPFLARGGGDVDIVLGEVIAEELIRDLSRSAELNLISRLSTTAFRNRNATASEIGNNLQVEYVLSGAYSIDGRNITIDSELANSKTGRIVWTKRQKARVSGLRSGRREIIDLIAADVSDAVMKRELQRAQSQALPTLTSYTLLIAAIGLMHRLSLSSSRRRRSCSMHLWSAGGGKRSLKPGSPIGMSCGLDRAGPMTLSRMLSSRFNAQSRRSTATPPVPSPYPSMALFTRTC